MAEATRAIAPATSGAYASLDTRLTGLAGLYRSQS